MRCTRPARTSPADRPPRPSPCSPGSCCCWRSACCCRCSGNSATPGRPGRPGRPAARGLATRRRAGPGAAEPRPAAGAPEPRPAGAARARPAAVPPVPARAARTRQAQDTAAQPQAPRVLRKAPPWRRGHNRRHGVRRHPAAALDAAQAAAGCGGAGRRRAYRPGHPAPLSRILPAAARPATTAGQPRLRQPRLRRPQAPTADTDRPTRRGRRRCSRQPGQTGSAPRRHGRAGDAPAASDGARCRRWAALRGDLPPSNGSRPARSQLLRSPAAEPLAAEPSLAGPATGPQPWHRGHREPAESAGRHRRAARWDRGPARQSPLRQRATGPDRRPRWPAPPGPLAGTRRARRHPLGPHGSPATAGPTTAEPAPSRRRLDTERPRGRPASRRRSETAPQRDSTAGRPASRPRRHPLASSRRPAIGQGAGIAVRRADGRSQRAARQRARNHRSASRRARRDLAADQPSGAPAAHPRAAPADARPGTRALPALRPAAQHPDPARGRADPD